MPGDTTPKFPTSTRVSPSTTKTSVNRPGTDAVLPPPRFQDSRPASTDQIDETEWDFQWPFYGEGLQDTSLDWTLDFLSSGISTHSPLDPVYDEEEINPSAAMSHSVFDQLSGADPYHRGDFTRKSQPLLEESAGLERPTNEASTRETAEEPVRAHAHRRISFVEDADILYEKSQISEKVRRAMADTVIAPLLQSFCSEKGSLPESFPSIPTITHFINNFFVHVQPRFPVLHIPTFDSSKCSPNLLLAMAIIGSSYSELNQGKFALAYIERARMSIKLMQEKDQRHVRLETISHCD